MAYNSKRECPDCDGTDMGLFTFSKGNGLCKCCHGNGYANDLNEAISLMLVGERIDCDCCSGTGQCQSCGGSGYEYYYSNIYDEEDNNEDESTYSNGDNQDYSTSSSIDYSSYITQRTYAEDNDIGSVIGYLLAILFVLTIFIFGVIKCNRNSEGTTYSEPSIQQNYSSIASQSADVIMKIPENVEEYPAEEKIKDDLVAAQHLPMWDFVAASDFVKFNIENVEVKENVLYQSLELILQKGDPIEYYKTSIKVGYQFISNQWRLYDYSNQTYLTNVRDLPLPAYPNSKKIQSDLLSIHALETDINNTIEYGTITIVDSVKTDDTLFQTIRLHVLNKETKEEYAAELIVSYLLDFIDWKISNFSKQSLYSLIQEESKSQRAIHLNHKFNKGILKIQFDNFNPITLLIDNRDYAKIGKTLIVDNLSPEYHFIQVYYCSQKYGVMPELIYEGRVKISENIITSIIINHSTGQIDTETNTAIE